MNMAHEGIEDYDEHFGKLVVTTDTKSSDVDDDDVPLVPQWSHQTDGVCIGVASPLAKVPLHN
jgi:hypothetical protein